MKKIQAPKVVARIAAIRMHCGELKLNLGTSNSFHKFNTSWIDLKILPYKIDYYTQLFQQVFLNWILDAKVTGLQIGLPNYVKTLFVPLGDEGLTPKCSS